MSLVKMRLIADQRPAFLDHLRLCVELHPAFGAFFFDQQGVFTNGRRGQLAC